jgi:hypothetical protein
MNGWDQGDGQGRTHAGRLTSRTRSQVNPVQFIPKQPFLGISLFSERSLPSGFSSSRDGHVAPLYFSIDVIY